MGKFLTVLAAFASFAVFAAEKDGNRAPELTAKDIAPMVLELDGVEYPVVAKDGDTHYQVFKQKDSAPYFANEEGESTLVESKKASYELEYAVLSEDGKKETFLPIPRPTKEKTKGVTASRSDEMDTKLVCYGCDGGGGGGFYGGYAPCFNDSVYPYYGGGYVGGNWGGGGGYVGYGGGYRYGYGGYRGYWGGRYGGGYYNGAYRGGGAWRGPFGGGVYGYGPRGAFGFRYRVRRW